MGAEGLLLSRHQEELTPGRWLAAVIAHVAAGSIHAVSAAGETISPQQALVAVIAGESRKSAFRADGIGEKLVRPSMIAQRPALNRTRCNRSHDHVQYTQQIVLPILFFRSQSIREETSRVYKGAVDFSHFSFLFLI